jgi:hypothetical protein
VLNSTQLQGNPRDHLGEGTRPGESANKSLSPYMDELSLISKHQYRVLKGLQSKAKADTVAA